MNKTINIIIFALLLGCFKIVSGQNDNGIFEQSFPSENGFLLKSTPQRSGKFITDSAYYYRANLFGQQWLNISQYKVTQRDQFGNFITATTSNYDTLQLNWYAANTYEASYFDSLHTAMWTANVYDLKVGVWRMSDSILYLPGGSPQIAWYKVWNPDSYKFLRGKRITYFYLENGNTEKQYSQAFDTLTRQWKNDRQDFYTYNEQDLMNENLVIVWDTLNLLWAKRELINFSYDENGLLTGQINQEWRPDINNWKDTFKIIFLYTPAGLPGERFVYQWSDDIGDWKNMSHTINHYNESSLLSETLSQYWDEDEKKWIDNSKITYLYNEQGKKTEVVYLYWDVPGYWSNLSKYNYAYDENGNRTEYLFKSWDFVNDVWEDYYKEETYWSEFTPFAVEELYATAVKVFPNPAREFINITFETTIKNAVYSLFSEDGKLLQTKAFSGVSSQINTSDFLPGIYILKVLGDGINFTQKIIIN